LDEIVRFIFNENDVQSLQDEGIHCTLLSPGLRTLKNNMVKIALFALKIVYLQNYVASYTLAAV